MLIWGFCKACARWFLFLIDLLVKEWAYEGDKSQVLPTRQGSPTDANTM